MTIQQPPVEQYKSLPNRTSNPSRLAANGLGIAALVLGIVGLVIAFVPLVGGFGGFVGVIGLVLGLIAVFQRGKKKGAAIAGAAISGFALIMSIVMGLVYTAAFVSSVDQAMNDDAPAFVEQGAASVDPQGADADDAEVVGTRAKPGALGTTVQVKGGDGMDWEVTPLSAVLDVTSEVKAANSFNQDPEPGNVYAKLDVALKYLGPDSGSPSELDFIYVSAAGQEYNGSFVVMDGQLSGVTELYAPGEATGSVIIEIPSEGADQGTWGISYVFGDPIFFKAI